MTDNTAYDPWIYTGYPGEPNCQHKYIGVRMPNGPNGPSWRYCEKCGKQIDYKKVNKQEIEGESRKEINELLTDFDPLISGSKAMHTAYENIKERSKTEKL